MNKAQPTVIKTAKYGDWDVPVLFHDWVAQERRPYRKTYCLLPGQHWKDAPTTELQWEHYVLSVEDGCLPVGALIARELVQQGATHAAFTELWAGRCVLVGPDLVCLPSVGPLINLVETLKTANHGKLGGLPDVIAIFEDGRVAMREAKNIAAKDRLGAKQHSFASVCQRLLGNKLDLAVVEWGVKTKGAAKP